MKIRKEFYADIDRIIAKKMMDIDITDKHTTKKALSFIDSAINDIEKVLKSYKFF